MILDIDCFFLNLKAWKLTGSPEYYSDNKDVTKIKRSLVNFHDDYTPTWIKKDDDLPESDLSKRLNKIRNEILTKRSITKQDLIVIQKFCDAVFGLSVMSDKKKK